MINITQANLKLSYARIGIFPRECPLERSDKCNCTSDRCILYVIFYPWNDELKPEDTWIGITCGMMGFSAWQISNINVPD